MLFAFDLQDPRPQKRFRTSLVPGRLLKFTEAGAALSTKPHTLPGYVIRGLPQVQTGPASGISCIRYNRLIGQISLSKFCDNQGQNKHSGLFNSMHTNTDFESQKEKLAVLCQQLKSLKLDDPVLLAKTREQLLGSHDVYRWFVPREYGGFEWTANEILSGYLELSSACLSTAFVLTQRSGAVKRITISENQSLKTEWLPKLAAGDCFSTVGISHLTTSRRHLGKPVLEAEPVTGGFRLNGFTPWVTGVTFADSVVVGATCPDDTEILINVPTDLDGIHRPAPPELVALTDSCTGEFRCENVLVDSSQLIDGPAHQIMSRGSGGNTGGLQTSTLAIGLSKAAIDYIDEQSAIRDGFSLPLSHLKDQWQATKDYLFAVAEGDSNCSNEQLRIQANSLVLRSTQAALMVAKGAGYCDGHPVGRWCQEALFFLVWSCPQPVADSNLCELAQISE